MSIEDLQEEAVDLNGSQWGWLVQHACHVANYPIRVGFEESDEGPVIVGKLALQIPSKIEGAGKLIGAGATFSLGRSSVYPAEAWALAIHIAKTLHNRCMAKLVGHVEFRDFINSEDSVVLVQ